MGKNLNLCPIILENKTEEKELVIGRNCVYKVSNWSFEATVFSEGKILNDRSSNYISDIQKKDDRHFYRYHYIEKIKNKLTSELRHAFRIS